MFLPELCREKQLKQVYLAGKLSDHELTEEELYSDLRKLDTPEAA